MDASDDIRRDIARVYQAPLPYAPPLLMALWVPWLREAPSAFDGSSPYVLLLSHVVCLVLFLQDTDQESSSGGRGVRGDGVSDTRRRTTVSTAGTPFDNPSQSLSLSSSLLSAVMVEVCVCVGKLCN